MSEGPFCPRPFPATHSHHIGRSLIELLATVAIAGVLASSAVPAYQDWLADTRLVTQTNALIRDLHFARTTSIMLGSEVLMCESSDHETCTRRRDWGNGWIVFADENGNRQREATEQALLINTGFKGSIIFKAQGIYGYRHVLYRPTGSAKNGTFTLCDWRGHARAVILHMSGRPRVAYTQADGSALPCPAS